MSSFDLYSAYYDLFYRDKDYSGEVSYIAGLASDFGRSLGPAMLDLGCGTGRHALLFAEQAGNVVGVDVSESMIAAARDRASRVARGRPGTTSFVVSDIRAFRSEQRFDTVVSLFHVLSYQVTNADQDKFFETARLHLKPGGLLIFDFWYGPAVLMDPPKHVERSVEGGGFRATRRTTPRLRVNENRVDVRFDIEVTRLATGEVERFSEDHHMRYVFLPEIAQRLQSSGLRPIASHKWLSREPPDETGWYASVVAVAD